jgi:hypothetical protein
MFLLATFWEDFADMAATRNSIAKNFILNLEETGFEIWLLCLYGVRKIEQVVSCRSMDWAITVLFRDRNGYILLVCQVLRIYKEKMTCTLTYLFMKQ